MMKALVTGGGGFLGSYIVEQLIARGDEVCIFARGDYPALARLGARVVRGDICDSQAISRACTGAEVVFHVAAHAGLWGTWDSFYRPNVIGTDNVITACRTKGISKLVYTSSPSVVFNNQSHDGVDESLPYPTHYESFYAKTKATAEQNVIRANSAELLTVSLRPHLIWGPRDTQILPRIIARAQAGRLVQVGDGTNKVDLTYVEDAARAHLLAADALNSGSAIAGSVYFISQDDPVQLWPWINNLLTRVNIPPVKRRLSLRTARAIGGMLELAYRSLRLPGEPRLTRFLASELALNHHYNIARAKRDLQYYPRYSMAEALEKTVAFLRQQGTHV
jgi:nucleoside-diphosphate-sugar epimerase